MSCQRVITNVFYCLPMNVVSSADHVKSAQEARNGNVASAGALYALGICAHVADVVLDVADTQECLDQVFGLLQNVNEAWTTRIDLGVRPVDQGHTALDSDWTRHSASVGDVFVNDAGTFLVANFGFHRMTSFPSPPRMTVVDPSPFE